MTTPPSADRWVDAAPFRAHLQFLTGTTGLRAAHVAVLAGLPPKAVERLAATAPDRPVRRIGRDMAHRLFDVQGEEVLALRRRLVPAGRARSSLRRLRANGGDLAGLAERVGVEVGDLEILSSGVGHCSAWLALQLIVADSERSHRLRGRSLRSRAA